ETRWLRKDGTQLSVLLSASALREGNLQAGSVFSAVDISAQKTAETALRASEERTRLLLDTIQQGVLESDRDGRVIYSNPAAAKISEKSRQELAGSFIWDLVDLPGGAEGLRRRIEQLWRERPDPHPIEFTHLRRDGNEARIIVEWQFKRDSSGQPCGFVLLINDVSEKTRLEDRLRQAQKIEAVGQLAGGVAHDFNNLLTPIIGYSEMLLYSTPESDPRHNQLHEVLKAAERARKLVQQLLAFGRKQMFEMKVLDLNQVLEGFQHILHQAIREDIELTIRPETGLTHVRGDQSQIEVAVMNLVVNAQDAMPRGGKILIETANTAFDEEYCRCHPPSHPGTYVMLAISDTGEGMSAEVQRHLFEPFYTTKKMGRGTGLGLATVYGITKQHNGFIWAYSEVGQGTTFKIFLPSVDEPAEPEMPDTPATTAGRHGGETILLMEDDPTVCELVRTILVKAGYQVLTPAGIEACRQLFDKQGDAIDMLLSDVVMPELSGPQLYRELVHRKPSMKVLYMSGYTEEIIASHGILDLGGQFIQKPITTHSLTAKVREVLDS
ncbi:MAG TPA: ATP-binding protein, partial [Candidatus Aminicenantes bacterium]|nr:ATP-binding protein [Candidatus Aminicenantes bacterium]